MSDSMGLSIGTTNLVAAPASGPPTVRRAVVTLYPHRPPEVGVPSENSQLNERGTVVSGFVERVGDPVPMVADDGSRHWGERLVAEALGALVRAASPYEPPASMTATVPSHWPRHVVDALRAAVATKPNLSNGGNPLPLVTDAVAALTALQAQPGLPARGVVVLCDFGATGTSITLADAARRFAVIGDTVRHEGLSGDLIDQAVLRHVLTEVDIDPASTSAIGSLTHLREQCRVAKERLSGETATGFTGPLPGARATVRVTRPELEALLRDPLEEFIAAVVDTLQRNNIAPANLVALATVGGGARIPLVTQRLSEALRMPVTTTAAPHLLAALGAGLIARRGPDDESATGLVAPPAYSPVPQAVVPVAAAAALAWSQDESTDDVDLASYSDHPTAAVTDGARPEVHFEHGEYSAAEQLPPLPWYRRPVVLFGAAATVVLIAAAGFVATLATGHEVSTVPAGTNAPSTAPSAAAPVVVPPPSTQAPAPPVTTVVVQQQAPTVPRRTQTVPATRVASPPSATAPPPPAETPPPVVTSEPVATPTPVVSSSANPIPGGSICGLAGIPAEFCGQSPSGSSSDTGSSSSGGSGTSDGGGSTAPKVGSPVPPGECPGGGTNCGFVPSE